MSETTFFSHTLLHAPPSQWHGLEEHLRAVSKGAGDRAAKFGASEWGRCAGLWHDLGKYSAAFQGYLRSSASPDGHVAETRGSVDHSTAGAQHAVRNHPLWGHLLAYCIAGHHAGLADIIALDGGSSGLATRLQKSIEPWEHGLAELPELDPGPAPESFTRGRDPFALALLTRMVFSSLCDADFLDTEAFMNPEQASQRPRGDASLLGRMNERLESHIAAFSTDSPVNRARHEVYEACKDAASQPQGLFSLTVPTGGGKTLASLAFALRHAMANDLDRVIYAIPFTSIIEQNAAVFREIFDSLGEDLVVEHHSNYDFGTDSTTSRLATENWDAPLVVTTNVQLFESLFASRTSRCRKLHNIARSVIILDEAQAMPVRLLAPTLRCIETLADHFKTSFVFCTATQPAIQRREDFREGLEGIWEIIPEPKLLYKTLRRVDVEQVGLLSDEELVAKMRKHERVLCIVNTRGHARKLFDALGSESNALHLSATMCPEHRTAVLAEVRARLASKRPCRLIATQLIEAGVDVDFPVVFRSLAGLDSIAQAAGRCNRNGLLPERGKTYVFRSEHPVKERFLRPMMQDAAQIAEQHEDLLSPEAIEHYFRLHYWGQRDRDQEMVLDCFELRGHEPSAPFGFNFREASARFRWIDDDGVSIIVPWRPNGERLVEALRHSTQPVNRKLLRKLQRYTVQIRERAYKENASLFEAVHGRYLVLTTPKVCYSESLGLILDKVSEGLIEV